MNVPLTIPDLDDLDIDHVVAVLKSGMLVQGLNVKRIEEWFTKYLSVHKAFAVSNGTVTMHMALEALGVGPGDEVIVPAFSYVATANVVEYVGAKPVFVDIDLASVTINVDLIERAITPKTKAIIPVHEFGVAADMDSILALARKYNLQVIEDAACALGTLYKGKMVGSLGDFGSFSLHPRKSVTCGEGGILTINKCSQSLIDHCSGLRNHGISDELRTFEYAGMNFRLTDIQGALLLGQLGRFNHILSHRKSIANKYLSSIDTPYFDLPFDPDYSDSSWQSFHLLMKKGSRSEFFSYMNANGIQVNYGAQCIPVLPYYKKKYGYSNKDFKNAYQAYTQGVVIPLYSAMEDDKIQYVIETINNYSQND